MARPLSTSEPHRANTNGAHPPRFSQEEAHAADPGVARELEHLRHDNSQLRALCAELEQALQEAASQQPVDLAAVEERLREYEQLIDEKSETIRRLHQELQEARAVVDGAPTAEAAKPQGPMPAEDELLRLSEELERERRQLQEDEQSLMEQMRQMEMTMARERAEMARQRNDLQRLYGEIRHELERLERNGALQNKMDELKAKLQDASTRRGASPSTPGGGKAASSPPPPTTPQQPPPGSQGKGFMGRLFGK